MCDVDIFPSIKALLQILATLPISIASVERSFFTLLRLNTWLRSQMSETRLTGLALLHTHRDIPVDCDKVIDRFTTEIVDGGGWNMCCSIGLLFATLELSVAVPNSTIQTPWCSSCTYFCGIVSAV
ncbi:hypothetical protein HPB48_017790 [Haemaphysalis longicornis]|uniref:HAT C-terminal dimerisation domain-containing protein n=1 Tax=Haemaphysalis longicornis TaxID=44386 RepID=A0A9J6FXU9_HAELO|nr:hypothetical protein HPB48_017790 [Haemaphysalis longicornis]